VLDNLRQKGLELHCDPVFQTIAMGSVSSAVNSFKFNVSFWCDYCIKTYN